MRAAARTRAHNRQRRIARNTKHPNNMAFPITPLATIEREAKAAAEKGLSPNHACRFPFEDPAGEAFVRIYNEHRATLKARAVQQPEGTQ